MKRFLVVVCALCLFPVSQALAQPTRSDYIAQADSICVSGLEGQSRALRGFLSDVKKGRLKKAARKFQRAGSAFSGGVDQLAALSPPPEDSSMIASWLESLRAQVPIINNYAKALAKGKGLRVLNLGGQLQRASAQSQQIVRGYGFQVCNHY
jgi:hypothetical protein